MLYNHNIQPDPFKILPRTKKKKGKNLNLDSGKAVLEEIIDSSVDFLYTADKTTPAGAYSYAERTVDKVKYNLADTFLFWKERYKLTNNKEYRKIGIFMSALTNKIIQEDEELYLDISSDEIDFIGMKHSKGSLKLRGYAGKNLSYMQNGGDILLLGDANSQAGKYMSSGNLTIKGDSGSFLGTCMTGGRIDVFGDAGSNIARLMRNGHINVRGDIGILAGSFMKGGSLKIGGDSGNLLGMKMMQGRIDARGDVGNFCCKEMQGGLVSIRGDAGKFLGKKMENGLIVLSGKADKDPGKDMEGGKITIYNNDWHHNKLSNAIITIEKRRGY